MTLPCFFTACVPGGMRDDYRKSVLDRPKPAGEAALENECRFLRSEIARQESIVRDTHGDDVLPETKQLIKDAAQANIDALQSREAYISCKAEDHSGYGPNQSLPGQDNPPSTAKEH